MTKNKEDATITERLPRHWADLHGREGVLALMRDKYPHAGLTHCLFDQSWPNDEPAWCLGDFTSVRVFFDGNATVGRNLGKYYAKASVRKGQLDRSKSNTIKNLIKAGL